MQKASINITAMKHFLASCHIYLFITWDSRHTNILPASPRKLENLLSGGGGNKCGWVGKFFEQIIRKDAYSGPESMCFH